VGFAVLTRVCDAAEYDELRDRLPRRRRRAVPDLTPGHLGLIVQAVTTGDCPLRTIFGAVPSAGDPAAALARLERELRRSLGETSN
jgi:hypothetical protein